MDNTLLQSHFEFGANWAKFLDGVDQTRLQHAVADIEGFVGRDGLRGKEFLDIGCGSGLSSMAAYSMGASRIISVDIDPLNAENVRRFKDKFGVPPTYPWSSEVRSIVDALDVAQLPMADVVYSWGVLHHTGRMWFAIENAASKVKPGGWLYLMLYRDATLAPVWRVIKRTYTRGPAWLKWLMRNSFAGVMVLGMLAKHRSVTKVKASIREYGKSRGMSWYTDLTDWIGGYPFEYAEAEDVIAFLVPLGFLWEKISPEITRKSLGWRGTGSYQYLFKRVPEGGE